MLPGIKKTAKAVSVFCVVFAITLIIWLWIKPYYAKIMVTTGSHLAAAFMDAKVLECKNVKGGVQVDMAYFAPALNSIREFAFSDILITDRYSFNIPLTLAILASITTIVRLPWLSIVEGIIFISSGHLLWIISFLLVNVKSFVIREQHWQMTAEPNMFTNFIWQFSDNMLIRFEPFIIPAVLWMLHGLKLSKESNEK